MATIEDYKKADAPLPGAYEAWQLHGAGFEHIGTDGKPETLALRPPADNEVMLRVDALGLCLSDIKIIKQGGAHARLRGRDLSKEPTVLGHECSATVVKVGKDWEGKFRPGQRFVVQADIYYKGVGYAFGYVIPGGLAQYTYLDERALAGDEGCYLLAVDEELGYSQAALSEPWACVEMSYNLSDERKEPRDGRVLVVSDLELPSSFEDSVHVGGDLAGLNDGDTFDDIIVFEPRFDTVQKLAGRLNADGNMYLLGEAAEDGPVTLDIGRIHYEGLRYFGGADNHDELVRAHGRYDLKAGGASLFVGAGGPMGQMHVQRAVEVTNGPKTIVATDLDHGRLAHIQNRFGGLASEKGIALHTVCPADFASNEDFDMKLRELAPEGYDDICILAPVAKLAADFMPLAADYALMNVFAGVGIGQSTDIMLSDLCRGIRIFGSSGSRIADMNKILAMVEKRELNTNLSVAAIGGLHAAKEGLAGLAEARFPGKTVIYTQIPDLELMSIADVPAKLPFLADKLGPNGEWTKEAEFALMEKYAL